MVSGTSVRGPSVPHEVVCSKVNLVGRWCQRSHSRTLQGSGSESPFCTVNLSAFGPALITTVGTVCKYTDCGDQMSQLSVTGLSATRHKYICHYCISNTSQVHLSLLHQQHTN